MKRGSARRVAWLVAVAAWTICAGDLPAAGPGASPSALLEAVRHNELDFESAVELRSTEIPVGIATLRVDRALLIPARPVAGRTIEFVLLGSAWFDVMPPDEIEAGQLELFTGRRQMNAPVSSAVLVLVDAGQIARLLEGSVTASVDPGRRESARTVYANWQAGAERDATGAEAGIFRALYGDSAYARYFAIWCRSPETGEWVYTYDPEEDEQLTIAAFERPEIRGWDRIRLARHIRFQQRKGRFLGMELEDFGAWDIWLSTEWSPDGDRGGFGFETRHYDLDVRVRRRSLRIEGQATLDVEATVAGRQTLSLELFRDLEVDSVRDGEGNELFAFRSGPDLIVSLPRPTTVGQKLELRIAYGGQVLEWRGKGTYDLVTTDGWYPHCGSIDRATYDVTVSWPKKFQMLAAGRLIDSGESGNYRWQRRVLETPSIAFTFVVGRYEIVERRIGDTRLRLAFSRATGRPDPKTRERTVDVIVRSLGFLEHTFGPYPLDELTVVILPRGFSQSFLGFVALSDSVARAAGAEPYDMGQRIRETLIAHELAHQWWGNLVGWWSYRDQWLSEAMANYAAMLFHVESSGGGSALLSQMSAGWRASLERTVASGHSVDSLGPIVLGSRLNSSRADNGYTAIVYRKGAVVLAMLARAVGEREFLGILRDIVRESSGQVMTTREFIDGVAERAGLDLEGFARQYVYGTGIPRVYYDYEVDRGDTDVGAWRLSGEARRLIEARHSWSVEPRSDGTWDVVRRSSKDPVDRGTAVMVPFRIVANERSTDGLGAAPNAGPAVVGGRLMLHGTQEAFSIDTTIEPDRLVFDPRGEILAYFYSVDGSPKRVARFRGQDLLLENKPEEAERVLLDALEQPLGAPVGRSAVPWLRDAEAEERDENATIHLTLARFYLDTGRETEAERQLTAAEQQLGAARLDRRLEREVLWARLDLRRGHPETAYRRLKPTIGLSSANRPLHRDAERRHARRDRLALVEGYALMAVAAFETNHRTDFEWALAASIGNGVDVSRLVGPEGAPPGKD